MATTITGGASAQSVQHVLTEVSTRFHEVQTVANREAERRLQLEAIAPLTAWAPTMAADIHDLGGLLQLGAHLVGDR